MALFGFLCLSHSYFTIDFSGIGIFSVFAVFSRMCEHSEALYSIFILRASFPLQALTKHLMVRTLVSLC